MPQPDARPPSWGERRSLVLVFFASGTFFGLFLAMVTSATSELPLWILALQGVVSGSFFGGAMTYLIAKAWRRVGGFAMAEELRRALRSGQVPTDADRTEWDGLLARQEQDAHLARGHPLLLAVLSVGFVALALTNSLPELGPLPWVGVVLFAGFAIYSPFETRTRLKRIRNLREQLEATSDRGGS